MAKNILEIAIKLTKEGGGDKQAVSALVNVKNSLSQFAVIAGTAAAAIATVDKLLDATVGKFISYAGEIRQSSAALSISAEETSRLTNVLDDFGVQLSSVEKALFTARKNGIDITVEGLANLADQYNALKDPQEKALFLQEKFGKQGTVLAEVMVQGSAAILAQNASIAEGLILNEQQLANALVYEQSIDDLKDAWDSLAITAGGKVVPALTNVLKSIQFILAVMATSGTAFEAMGYALAGMPDKAIAAWAEWRDEATNAVGGINFVFGESTARLDEFGNAIGGAAGEVADFSNQMSSLVGYAQDYDKTAKDIAEAEADLAKLRSQGYTENGKAITEAKNKIEELQTAQDKQTAQWMVNVLTQQLGIDGISKAEMDMLLQYQVDTGLLSEEGKKRAQAAWDEATAMSEAYASVQGSYYVDFYVTTHSSTPAGYGGGSTRPTANFAAAGGNWQPGDMTIVGDVPGLGWGPNAEVIMPDGRIVPHNVAEQMRRAGLLRGVPAFALGGSVSTPEGGWYKPPAPPKPSWGSTKDPVTKQSWGSASPTKSSWGGKGGEVDATWPAPTPEIASYQPAQSAAVEAVAPVVTEAVQSFQATSQTSTRENTAQVAKQTAAVERSGQETAAILRRIADAIEGQAEVLAAEIQKRGG